VKSNPVTFGNWVGKLKLGEFTKKRLTIFPTEAAIPTDI
jgi:hypothetical protein